MAVWCLGLHFSSVSCLIFMRPWWGAILWDLVWHLKPCFSGDFPGVELDTETRFSLISWIPIEGLIQFLSHWIWSGCAVVCHRRDWITSHMVAWWSWSARRWRLSFGNPLFAHFTLFPIPAVSQVTCDLVLLVYYDWKVCISNVSPLLSYLGSLPAMEEVETVKIQSWSDEFRSGTIEWLFYENYRAFALWVWMFRNWWVPG